MKTGFDHKKYVKIQSTEIKKRIKSFDKLYLEVGGKLFDDAHASRVLPGFKSDAKISMFMELKDDLEIIFCINANDIEKNKIRAEHGITYDVEVMRLIDNLKNLGFLINSVVITLYTHQPSVDTFVKKLERFNIKTYIHQPTKGYPTDVNVIVSEDGYGANPYIETSRKLVLVNAPGPGSGKLATCLSQLYHEGKRGVHAGYAKFETFPVWNLPLKHPVNVAYEAATADLRDVNMIDSFHLESYNKIAINYNRDLEQFPLLKSILFKIYGKNIYNSPTDMGVNCIGSCITNNDVLIEAGKKEIVRRYFQEMTNYKMGLCDIDIPEKIKSLMHELDIDEDLIKCRKKALEKSMKENVPVVAIEIKNKIVTGKESTLLSAPSALILNVIKMLSKIPDSMELLSPTILEPILKLKKNRGPLQLQEILIALSICSVTNPMVGDALKQLDKLKDCDAHASHIITNGDLKTLKELNIRLTCEPKFKSDNLYLN